MFDTNLVIVGNVLTRPEWRRIANTGSLVAHFRVASTARRYDRENNRWVDGNNLKIRVSAWRRLAEGIASSVRVGDPVIVYGRVYSRNWKDDKDNARISYEMEAYSIGHDLARGRSQFYRGTAEQSMAVIEDAEGAAFVAGEYSAPLSEDEAPVKFGDGMPERLPGELEPTFVENEPEPEPEPEPDELTLEVERLAAEQPAAPRRSRRSSKREPIAA